MTRWRICWCHRNATKVERRLDAGWLPEPAKNSSTLQRHSGTNCFLGATICFALKIFQFPKNSFFSRLQKTRQTKTAFKILLPIGRLVLTVVIFVSCTFGLKFGYCSTNRKGLRLLTHDDRRNLIDVEPEEEARLIRSRVHRSKISSFRWFTHPPFAYAAWIPFQHI